MENKPRISNWILGGYIFLAAFIVSLYVTLIFLIPFTAIYAYILLNVVMILVSIVICAIAVCLYRTTYSVKDGMLISWSPFASIKVKLKDLTKMERTMIPFSFKGFGASAYSGWFYIPTVGWTRVLITNLSDGVLLKSKEGKNYLITPSDPDKFIRSLKGR